MGKLGQTLRQTNQQQLRVGVFIEEIAAGRKRHVGPVIPPHAVNSDSYHGKSLRIEHRQ